MSDRKRFNRSLFREIKSDEFKDGVLRTNIDIDEKPVRKARKLARLKSKRQIVNKALEFTRPFGGP
jgi:hypothetical protein